MLQICENVRLARIEAGKTQLEVAEAAGVKRSTYANWEKTIEPDIDTLRKIAKFLDKSLQDLIATNDDLHSNSQNTTYLKRRRDEKNGVAKDIPAFAGNTRAGNIEVYSDDPSMQTPIATLPAHLFPGCNHAEKVNGDSMYPLIVNQGWLIGKITDKMGIIWGEKYIIHTKYGSSVVKYIHPSTKGEQYIKIKSHNKSVPDQDIPKDDITFCCRVYFIINPS